MLICFGEPTCSSWGIRYSGLGVTLGNDKVTIYRNETLHMKYAV